MQPDAIPEELFREAETHLGAQLEAVRHDPLEWDRLIGTACFSSLLARQPEAQTISLHRLVQAVVLDTMAHAEQEQWNERVLEALDAVFPAIQVATPGEYAIWQRCERLLPHVLGCVQRIPIGSEPLVCASLTFNAAQYLQQRGRFPEAEPLYRRALQCQERLLGGDHLQVATSLHALAVLSAEQGRYAEAELLALRALHLREQHPDAPHPQVASSLSMLAYLYTVQGRYAEAEPLALQALHFREQALGEMHPLVAVPLNNLADLYLRQGKYAAAESLARRALQIQEQALGHNHPRLSASLDNLATALRHQGQFALAEPLLQRALEIQEQALGPDHIKRADLLNDLANLLRDQGKDAQRAMRLYQRALSIRERHVGLVHPETAHTLHDLALLHQQQGRLTPALALASRAHAIREQTLGEGHPETVATRALVTRLRHERGGAEVEPASAPGGEVMLVPDSTTCDTANPSTAPHGAGPGAPGENVSLQGFLDACCERHPRAWCRSSDLWRAYTCWTQEHQERFPLSRRAFAAHLQAQGYHADRTNSARIWRGIALRSPDP
jgi:tetratricopeptide (TPR) repeat protein